MVAYFRLCDELVLLFDIINKREEEGHREELKVVTKIHNKLRSSIDMDLSLWFYQQ
jgi:hypothetical protein